MENKETRPQMKYVKMKMKDTMDLRAFSCTLPLENMTQTSSARMAGANLKWLTESACVPTRENVRHVSQKNTRCRNIASHCSPLCLNLALTLTRKPSSSGTLCFNSTHTQRAFFFCQAPHLSFQPPNSIAAAPDPAPSSQLICGSNPDSWVMAREEI